MARWVMVVDLRKCIGCGDCQQVCEDINKLPHGANWRQVSSEKVEKASGKRLSIPRSCMHCEDPPCLKVCPSRATHQRHDGIVEIDYDRCLGCGSCIVACPYGARSILEADLLTVDTKAQGNGSLDRIGICTKCNFCLKRLEKGIEKGLQPGLDSEATPMCVRCCISEALYFGDAEDPKSTVSQMISENKVKRLGEDIGTKPSVYYIVERFPEEDK